MKAEMNKNQSIKNIYIAPFLRFKGANILRIIQSKELIKQNKHINRINNINNVFLNINIKNKINKNIYT